MQSCADWNRTLAESVHATCLVTLNPSISLFPPAYWYICTQVFEWCAGKKLLFLNYTFSWAMTWWFHVLLFWSYILVSTWVCTYLHTNLSLLLDMQCAGSCKGHIRVTQNWSNHRCKSDSLLVTCYFMIKTHKRLNSCTVNKKQYWKRPTVFKFVTFLETFLNEQFLANSAHFHATKSFNVREGLGEMKLNELWRQKRLGRIPDSRQSFAMTFSKGNSC